MAALQAAYGDSNRAVEFLINGIPVSPIPQPPSLGLNFQEILTRE